MGADQSSDNNRNQRPRTTQISEAEVQHLLNAQRQQYEIKLQQMAAQTAALNSAQPQTSSIERERAPYSYSGNQLQTAASAPAPPANLYPTLNHPTTSNTRYDQNNSFVPTPQDFVFVNFGQTASHSRAAPTASAPSAPSPARRPASRQRGDRSVSRNRIVPQERDVLDCPTCYSRYGLKIFQCDSGHSSCSNCKMQGRNCGLCGMPITDRRNFNIESLAAQTKAPCPHASEGCKLFIKVIDMESHIAECPFGEQECPLSAVFGTCRWKGKLSQISNHFDRTHPTRRQTNVDTEMQLTNIRRNSQEVHLVLLGVYNFLIHIKVSEMDSQIYMAVQLIGTKMSAAKWLYEIHVYNKRESRRKYLYTDTCRSSSDAIDDVFKDKECAVLPLSYASTMVCNEAVAFKFFIKRSDEDKKVYYNNRNQRGRGRKPQ